MDTDKKAKITELRALTKDIAVAVKAKDKETVKAKYEERKQKVREFKESKYL
jgi:hypothetical protein